MKIDKNNYLKMPESFHNSITSALEQLENNGAKKRGVLILPKKRIAVAACIVLALALGLIAFKTAVNRIPSQEDYTQTVTAEVTLKAVESTTAEQTTAAAVRDEENETTQEADNSAVTEKRLEQSKEGYSGTKNKNGQRRQHAQASVSYENGNNKEYNPMVNESDSISGGTSSSSSEGGLDSISGQGIYDSADKQYLIVVVTLDSQTGAADKQHTAEEFPGVDIVSITDVTQALSDGGNMGQMLKLKIKVSSYAETYSALKTLSQTKGVLIVSPIYIPMFNKGEII